MRYSGKGYLYETHSHTLEGSACARCTGAELARAYYHAGYTGIIITNHFFYGNTAVDRSLPWGDWVENYCKGYENAKEEGDRLGLQVFFGWESGYGGPEFLVYGPDKEWLLKHPEIRDASVEEQLELVHADGGIVIQAHPFREAPYIKGIKLYPTFCDGVEGYNTSQSSFVLKEEGRHALWNDKAVAYAGEHHLPLTSGSDQHTTQMLWGGMVFPEKLKDIHDFADAVKSRRAICLLDGINSQSVVEG